MVEAINEQLLDDLIAAQEKVSTLQRIREEYESFRSNSGQFEVELSKDDKPQTIRGIALKEGRWSRFYYSAQEIENGAETLEHKPIVCDHGKGIKDIVGEVIKSWWDKQSQSLCFSAEIVNKEIAELIKRGLINGVSIGADFDPVTTEHDLTATNVKFYELALTTRPAFQNGIKEILSTSYPDSNVDNVTDKEEQIMEELGVTPNNPSGYGKSNNPWVGPTLGSFTAKSWEDLTSAERGAIASHFAWSRTSPPEKYGDLKLPHHNPKSHAVVWRGVVAAMAALSGARGGVAIPSEDKSTVYSHLASHYRDFDKPIPSRGDVLSGRLKIMEGIEMADREIQADEVALIVSKDEFETLREANKDHFAYPHFPYYGKYGDRIRRMEDKLETIESALKRAKVIQENVKEELQENPEVKAKVVEPVGTDSYVIIVPKDKAEEILKARQAIVEEEEVKTEKKVEETKKEETTVKEEPTVEEAKETITQPEQKETKSIEIIVPKETIAEAVREAVKEALPKEEPKPEVAIVEEEPAEEVKKEDKPIEETKEEKKEEIKEEIVTEEKKEETIEEVKEGTEKEEIVKEEKKPEVTASDLIFEYYDRRERTPEEK